jgi:hypothetical protein
MVDTLIICFALGIHVVALVTAIVALRGGFRGQYGKRMRRSA